LLIKSTGETGVFSNVTFWENYNDEPRSFRTAATWNATGVSDPAKNLGCNHCSQPSGIDNQSSRNRVVGFTAREQDRLERQKQWHGCAIVGHNPHIQNRGSDSFNINSDNAHTSA